MLDANEQRRKAIWKQTDVPIILRRGGNGEKLRVRLCGHEYAEKDSYWLKKERRIYPIWNSHLNCWEVPKAWFSRLVKEITEAYGKLYIIQPYREQEKCSPACQNAKGHECQCSCMANFMGRKTYIQVGSSYLILSQHAGVKDHLHVG
jgi:hypothetical protein